MKEIAHKLTERSSFAMHASQRRLDCTEEGGEGVETEFGVVWLYRAPIQVGRRRVFLCAYNFNM
jgi:hypothetical protein